ncbi:MAG: phosphatase PAP2 family protein, partial [Spirochaetes bacterium]|nr:phosphatase PAP2 family protein [Spirochaetota bacterium]
NFFTYLSYYAIGWTFFFIIILIRKKNDHYWLLWGFTFVLTYFLSDIILKNLIQRPRPFMILTDITINTLRTGSFSFPSSHAAFSGASFYVCTKIEKNRYLRITVFIVSIIISLSRLILKVHFLTDILAGYFLGLTAGFVINLILSRIYRKKINN